MRSVLVGITLLFSWKVYAQSYRPQQDWDFQNWSQEQREQKLVVKKSAPKKRRKRSRTSRQRRYLSSNQMNQRGLVLSQAKISSQNKVYGWDSAKLQASAGYGQGSITSASNYSGGTTGLRFSLGAHFDLSEDWTTSSFARVNYDTLNEDALNAPFGLSEIDAKAYDLGFAQRFLYQTSLSNFSLSPFIEGHAGRGYLKINESQQLSTGQVTAQTEFLYSKVGGAAGLQFELDELLPFVKFEYGFIFFDDVVSYEVNEADGSSRSGESVIENPDNLDYTYMTLSAGISYLF